MVKLFFKDEQVYPFQKSFCNGYIPWHDNYMYTPERVIRVGQTYLRYTQGKWLHYCFSSLALLLTISHEHAEGVVV
jgi:hypothetical protein